MPEMTQFQHSSVPVNRSMPPGTIIPEIAYPDVRAAAAWLCHAFGFTERLRIGHHRTQLCLDGGSVIAVELPTSLASGLPETTKSASVRENGSGYTLMVRVEDVAAHYEHARQHGARIVQPPADYPYGERQYTAEDLAGNRWTFSQSIADVDPTDWGGVLLERMKDTD